MTCCNQSWCVLSAGSVAHFGSYSRKMSKHTTVRLGLFSSLCEFISTQTTNIACPRPHTERNFVYATLHKSVLEGAKKGLINIQWWHKMVLCVSDSFFFVVIKAVVKWPFCLLPQRLVFQYPEQMVCVFHGWITEPVGFCVAGLDHVKLVCVSSWLSCENTPVSVSYIYIIKNALNSLVSFYFPQTLEEPPYLTVGTDVSAKYRGAFCEAKIKTAKRLVKAKVSHISKCSSSNIKNVLSVCVVCVKWNAAGRGDLVFVWVYNRDHTAQL